MCKNKPGWFKPGEAERVAEFLGLTLQQLFDQYLMPDSWELDDGNIMLLSPSIKGKEPGRYLSWPNGECIFLEDGACSIHPVKPYECRQAIHSIDHREDHEVIGLSWKEHQEQVDSLRYN